MQYVVLYWKPRLNDIPPVNLALDLSGDFLI